MCQDYNVYKVRYGPVMADADVPGTMFKQGWMERVISIMLPRISSPECDTRGSKEPDRGTRKPSMTRRS